ncbi:EthD family reductase [Erwinia mallotivora]|uniref:EthD family reductase n=1 Tax=Erwinia mallotivora TaxID=69222 RepID=UPI0021BE6D5E|nr:EthD family reductase [Erwinia mallotivora]
MIRYSVLYPHTANGTFDHDYYRDVHLPLIKARMGDKLLSYTIDRITAMPDGSAAPFVAACHLLCRSEEALQQGMSGHVDEIVADVANFTNIASIKWIAEVRE